MTTHRSSPPHPTDGDERSAADDHSSLIASSAVGVDVGGTTTRAVRFDAGRAAVSVAAPTPRGVGPIVDLIIRLVGEVIDGGFVDRIGVGIPGRVDVAAGVLDSAVNLDITRPVGVAAMLGDRLGRPVHVENDVNAAALGAFAHFGMPSASSLAYVNIGTGIAAGFVLGGHVWRGATGGAGEIGHVPMREAGPVCHCGQVGCAEAFGSGRTAGGDPARRRDVVAAAAWAVQLCGMTLDIDVVVLGGGMTRPEAPFLAELQDVLSASEHASPMLAAIGLGRRVAIAPAGVPLGSLGAALAAEATP